MQYLLLLHCNFDVLGTLGELLDALSTCSSDFTFICEKNHHFPLGNYSSFMQKEIMEQPESVVNTMRGRVNLESGSGNFIL